MNYSMFLCGIFAIVLAAAHPTEAEFVVFDNLVGGPAGIDGAFVSNFDADDVPCVTRCCLAGLAHQKFER